MPKLTFESVDELPTEFQSAASKDEASGKYVLDLSLTSKVTEFRDHNLELRRQKEELEGFRTNLFGVIGAEDPEQFDLDQFREQLNELKGISQQVADGKLIKDSSLESAVESRTSEMRGGYEKQKGELTKKLAEKDRYAEQLQNKLNDFVIQSHIAQVVHAADSEVMAEALPDILNRAKGVFRVDPEKLTVTPFGSDNQPIYGEDPTKPMSAREWVSNILNEAPHFSKASAGGGAQGGRQGLGVQGTGFKQVNADNAQDYIRQRKAQLAEQAKGERR